MKKKKPKAKVLPLHLARRLRERYGLKYSQFLHNSLIHQIRSGKAVRVRKQSLRVSIWDGIYNVRENDILDDSSVKPGEIKIRYVYDKIRKMVITVVPIKEPPNDQDCVLLQ